MPHILTTHFAQKQILIGLSFSIQTLNPKPTPLSSRQVVNKEIDRQTLPPKPLPPSPRQIVAKGLGR